MSKEKGGDGSRILSLEEAINGVHASIDARIFYYIKQILGDIEDAAIYRIMAAFDHSFSKRVDVNLDGAGDSELYELVRAEIVNFNNFRWALVDQVDNIEEAARMQAESLINEIAETVSSKYSIDAKLVNRYFFWLFYDEQGDEEDLPSFEQITEEDISILANKFSEIDLQKTQEFYEVINDSENGEYQPLPAFQEENLVMEDSETSSLQYGVFDGILDLNNPVASLGLTFFGNSLF